MSNTNFPKPNLPLLSCVLESSDGCPTKLALSAYAGASGDCDDCDNILLDLSFLFNIHDECNTTVKNVDTDSANLLTQPSTKVEDEIYLTISNTHYRA